jgi:isopenicillin-N N-acyltransferase-like protein
VCLNAIRAKPADPNKIPIHLALRICLSSPTSAAAVSTLEALGGIAASAHILIADPSGPRGLELSPLGNAYLDPDPRGMVFHTNHFLVNKSVQEPVWLSGSPVRLQRAKELVVGIDEEGKRVDGDVLRKRVFSDEFNAPQAICAKDDESRPVETRSRTLFSIAMQFEEGSAPRAEVVWGRPGSGDEGPVLDMPW